jgi:hypothetical protein
MKRLRSGIWGSEGERRPKKDRFWHMHNPIAWATFASLVFATIIFVFALAPTCNPELFSGGVCPPKWKHIYVARPNEVGDTLAGLAGVFAFIWLIGTVLLQSMELREQRKEFREQRIATQDMARAMAAQATVFEDEQRQRDELRAKELLEQKLKTLRGWMTDEGKKVRWKRTEQQSSFTIVSPIVRLFNIQRSDVEMVDSEFFRTQSKNLEKKFGLLNKLEGSKDLVERAEKAVVEPLLSFLCEISNLADRLSEDQLERIENNGINSFERTVQNAMNDTIWEHSIEVEE